MKLNNDFNFFKVLGGWASCASCTLRELRVKIISTNFIQF